jgi:CMP-N,N'-diacetyllegionaminic acid synthase
MNASLYAFSPNFLKGDKMIFDVPCGAINMRDTGILDLDSENDFELMQVIAKYLFDNYICFGIVKDNIKIL